MIKGIGADIIEIARIRKTLDTFGNGFLRKVFTQEEIDYCTAAEDPAARCAGRFAAKEAVLKALGRGLRGMKWKDIEVTRNPDGKPIVVLHHRAKEFAKLSGVTEIHLTISHCREYAVAYAISWQGVGSRADCMPEPDSRD